MPRREIPAVAIAVCAEFLAERETHSELDNLFSYAGAPGDPPEGNKLAKANAWLRRVNKDHSADPLRVLGRLVEKYMEEPFDAASPRLLDLTKWRTKFADVLAEHGLQYARGGHIIASLGVPTRTLQEFIQDRDLTAIAARESEYVSETHIYFLTMEVAVTTLPEIILLRAESLPEGGVLSPKEFLYLGNRQRSRAWLNAPLRLPSRECCTRSRGPWA
jgi:hypothetical protein